MADQRRKPSDDFEIVKVEEPDDQFDIVSVEPYSSPNSPQQDWPWAGSGPIKADADEKEFQSWYAKVAKKWDLSPDPDDPRHQYDYRAAHRVGAEPGPDGHWPSEFKSDEHPNRFVDNLDTKTGKRAGVPQEKIRTSDIELTPPAPLPRVAVPFDTSKPIEVRSTNDIDTIMASEPEMAHRAEIEQRYGVLPSTEHQPAPPPPEPPQSDMSALAGQVLSPELSENYAFETTKTLAKAIMPDLPGAYFQGVASGLVSGVLDPMAMLSAVAYAKTPAEARQLIQPAVEASAALSQKVLEGDGISLKDLTNPEWYMANLGQLTGSILSLAGSGIAGGMVGESLAIGLAGRLPASMLAGLPALGGNITATVGESLLEASNTYTDLVSKGIDPHVAGQKAAGVMAANMALLGLTNHPLFEAGGFAPGKQIKQMLSEGFQEGSQQVVSNLASGRPLSEGVAKSALLGGIGGPIAGAAIDYGMHGPGEGPEPTFSPTARTVTPEGPITPTPTQALRLMDQIRANDARAKAQQEAAPQPAPPITKAPTTAPPSTVTPEPEAAPIETKGEAPVKPTTEKTDDELAAEIEAQLAEEEGAEQHPATKAAADINAAEREKHQEKANGRSRVKARAGDVIYSNVSESTLPGSEENYSDDPQQAHRLHYLASRMREDRFPDGFHTVSDRLDIYSDDNGKTWTVAKEFYPEEPKTTNYDEEMKTEILAEGLTYKQSREFAEKNAPYSTADWQAPDREEKKQGPPTLYTRTLTGTPQENFQTLKKALNKAVKAKDWQEVIRQEERFNDHWERTGQPIPDDWARWQRAADDARFQLQRAGDPTQAFKDLKKDALKNLAAKSDEEIAAAVEEGETETWGFTDEEIMSPGARAGWFSRVIENEGPVRVRTQLGDGWATGVNGERVIVKHDDGVEAGISPGVLGDKVRPQFINGDLVHFTEGPSMGRQNERSPKNVDPDAERKRRNAINSDALEDALSPKAREKLGAMFKDRMQSRNLRHIREAMEIYDALIGMERNVAAENAAKELRDATESYFAGDGAADDVSAAAFKGLQIATGESDPDWGQLLENEVFASAAETGRLIFDTLDPKTAEFDTEEFNTAFGDVEFRKPKDEVFTAPDKPNNIRRDIGDKFMSQEEADSKLAEWKAAAKKIGETEDRSRLVVVSLFDRTGIMSQPYRDAGYTVLQFDIKNGQDLMDFGSWMGEIENAIGEDQEIVGVIAQPPCTSFASSGAQWWKSQHDIPDTSMVAKKYGLWAAKHFDRPIDYANTLVAITKLVVEQSNPQFYMMENPVGRIAEENGLPKPRLVFDPSNFGDPYTKQTQIWGDFGSDLPTANVFPEQGSLIHKLRGDVEEQKAKRSEASERFAYAFFMANHPEGREGYENLPASRAFFGKPTDEDEEEPADGAGIYTAPPQEPTEREKIEADLKAALDDLRAEVKQQATGQKPNAGIPGPLIVKTVRVVRQYARLGIHDAQEGWNRFRNDWGEGYASLKRVFEIAWEKVHNVKGIKVEDTDAITEPGVDPADVGSGSSPPREENAGGRKPQSKPAGGRGSRGGRVRGRDPGRTEPGSGVGAGEGGSESPPAAVPVATTSGPGLGNVPANTVIADAEALGRGSNSQKAKDNVEAIRLVKQIKAEDRYATADEQSALLKYVGWGGLKNELDELKDTLVGEGLLTSDEFTAAQKSRANAHYTAGPVVQAMWDGLRSLGFTGGRVLEPSMGIGHFIGLMPADLSAQSTFTGVELDPTTADIAKLLYPRMRVINSGLERTNFKDDSFDLVISNVPFGSYPVADNQSRYPSFIKGRIHNYFFAKALDKVRAGGYVAFISSHGTLDASDAIDARKYLETKADLIGAVRLPNTAFKGNAGTEVITDVIILRKRGAVEEAHARVEDWSDTSKVAMRGKFGEGSIYISKYFQERPGDVIGTITNEGKMRRGDGTEMSVRYEGTDIAKQLQKRIEQIAKDTPEDRMWSSDAVEGVKVLGKKAPKGEPTDITIKVNGEDHIVPATKFGDHLAVNQAKGKKLFSVTQIASGLQVAGPYNNKRTAEYVAWRLSDTGGRAWGEKTAQAIMAALSPEAKAEFKRLENPTVADRERQANENAVKAGVTAKELAEGIPAREDLPNYSYYVEKGVVRQKRGDVAVEIPPMKGGVERIKAQIGLRDIAQSLVRTEKMGPDADEREMVVLRKSLNSTYDAFVDKFGPLHADSNLRAFRQDPYAPFLLSLEAWDPDTKEATKSGIFSKRMSNPGKTADKADSAEHALMLSYAKLNRMDWTTISSLTGMTEEQAQEALVKSGRVFELPSGGFELREWYLSGRVKSKLLEARKIAHEDPRFQRNVDALEAVIPIDVDAAGITPRLGAGWVPRDVFTSFVSGLINQDIELTYNAALAEWSIVGDMRRNEEFRRWSVSGADFEKLLEHTLNGTRPLIRDDDGNKDAQATAIAYAKQEEMREAFGEWVYKDSGRKDRLVRLWNDTFNVIRLPEFDGSHLEFEGMSDEWRMKMRPHQKAFVWRALQSGNALAAHEVGLGKTLALAATAMEMKRLGLAAKPVIVVPKGITQQWGEEVSSYYPEARVLIATDKDFTPDTRQEFLSRIATGDWDIIVVPQTSLTKMPVSPEVEANYLREQIAEFRTALEDAREAGETEMTTSQMENVIASMEAQLQEKVDEARAGADVGMKWEDTGIDALLVDEAHEFRKLQIATRMQNVLGIPKNGSRRAFDLMLKIRDINARTPGRNVIFATGTPIMNTVAEMFVLQTYMQPEALKMAGIHRFDAWAAAFGKMQIAAEMNIAATGMVMKERFAKFDNVVGMVQMFRSFADVKFASDVETLKRPEMTGGAEQLVVAPGTEALKAYLLSLQARAAALNPRDRKSDNMLKISGDGRKAALDLRLVDVNGESHKLPTAANNIAEIYKKWDSKKGTQLAFLDLGTETDEAKGFSPYTHLKRLLIERGIKAEEIAFAQDYKDAERKLLFSKVNKGTIRVVIGSSTSLGVGVNVQKKIVALHHLDAPWMPAYIEQRNGRGIRQGNEFFDADPKFSVDVFSYVTEGSFDANMWQAVQRKAHMIRQALTGDLSITSIEDIGGGLELTAATIAAVASGNPLMVERTEVDHKLMQLSLQRRGHMDAKLSAQRRLAEYPVKIADAKKEIPIMRRLYDDVYSGTPEVTLFGKAMPLVDADKAIKEWAEVNLKDLESAEKIEGGKIALNVNGHTVTLSVDIGSIGGDTVQLKNYYFVRETEKLKPGQEEFITHRGGFGAPSGTPDLFIYHDEIASVNSTEGVVVKPFTRLVARAAEWLHKQADELEKQVPEWEQSTKAAQETVDQRFSKEDEYQRLIVRAEEIAKQLGERQDQGTADEQQKDDEEEEDKDSYDRADTAHAQQRLFTPASNASTTGQYKPIEFPELVELVRELTGSDPLIRRSLRGARGLFRSSPHVGRVYLAAELFRAGNEAQLGATIAHEIGHAVDWLPHKALKRGNLLGRLQSLLGFMKQSFTNANGVVVKNAAVRKELIAFSAEWRQWDRDLATKSERKYRDSARELYADALSGLLRDPELLRAKAPIFFREFFLALGSKPEVDMAYRDLQALLSRTREELLQHREATDTAMFEKGEQAELGAEQSRIDAFKAKGKDSWSRFKNEWIDKNFAIIDRYNELRKRGVRFTDANNPVYLLEESKYLGGVIKAWVDRNIEPIQKRLEAEGISWAEFGKVLMYERILAGDRAQLANPNGHSPKTARELYDRIMTRLGPANAKLLKQSAQDFRAAMMDVMEQAHDAGLYTDKRYDELKENKFYATFRVIEYVEKDVTARLYSMVGTTKGITNPADATIQKALAIIRATEHQKVKIASFSMLTRYFTSDIRDARAKGWGKDRVVMETGDPGFVGFYDKGIWSGKIVDPYIADTLNNTSIGYDNSVVKVLRRINSGWFRPVFTSFNLGFQLFNFARDFFRFWKNMPHMSMPRAIMRYWEAIPLAKVRAFGLSDKPTQTELRAWEDLLEGEENRIFSLQFRDLTEGRVVEDTVLKDIMARVQAGSHGRPPIKGNPITKPIKKLGATIQDVGNFIETLPKAAAMYEFAKGQEIGDITAEQRSHIRRKVGSPDYLAGGKYKPFSNEILLFSNAIVQAWRSDLEVAIDPRSASGFWWKTVALNFMPKLMMLALLKGWLGGDDDDYRDRMRQVMEKVSEYDKTNYLIVPLSIDGNGNAVYLRLPQDDTGRMLGGIVWKALGAVRGDETMWTVLRQLVDYSGGQFPSSAPIFDIGASILEYGAGRNPYDYWRGRSVLSQDEQRVREGGGNDINISLKYWGWVLQQGGLGIVTKTYSGEDRPKARSPLQKATEDIPFASPILARVLRVSKLGEIEDLTRAAKAQEGDEAHRRLIERREVNDAVNRYMQLKPWERSMQKRDQAAQAIVAEVYSDLPPDKQREKRKAISKKIAMGAYRGEADTVTDRILAAGSNAQKLAIIKEGRKNMSADEFTAWIKRAVTNKVITAPVGVQAQKFK